MYSPDLPIIFTNVINEESVQAICNGARPEETLVAKMTAKALKQLGLKPVSYSYETFGDKINITIKISR